MIESGRCGAVVYTANRIRADYAHALTPCAFFVALLSQDDATVDEDVWCNTLDGLRLLIETAAPTYINVNAASDEDAQGILDFLRGGKAAH